MASARCHEPRVSHIQKIIYCHLFVCGVLLLFSPQSYPFICFELSLICLQNLLWLHMIQIPLQLRVTPFPQLSVHFRMEEHIISEKRVLKFIPQGWEHIIGIQIGDCS